MSNHYPETIDFLQIFKAFIKMQETSSIWNSRRFFYTVYWKVSLVKTIGSQTNVYAIRVFFYLKKMLHWGDIATLLHFFDNPQFVLPSLLFIGIRLKRPLERSFPEDIVLSMSTPYVCRTNETI